MANIFLSVPVLGKPELRMMYTTYKAISTSRHHKVMLYFNENDSLISRVRNVHASLFLNDPKFKDFDYFMSLDSDIALVNVYESNNIFDKLIAHNLDFVGGLYSIKKPGEIRCASVTMDAEDAHFNTGLKEMRWLSSGCWCVKRSVMQKMAEAYPELTYNGDDNASGRIVHGLYLPFIYDFKDGEYNTDGTFRKLLSEDWSFCERWLSIGGKIYADTSIVLRHIGKIDYSLYNVEVINKSKRNPPNPGFELRK